MKIYRLTRKQVLPLHIEEAWKFFSSPKNLGQITPPTMDFQITGITGEGGSMYAGQLITYRIKLFPAIFTSWVTEITHVQAPFYFVDEQRFGPYRLWNHQHRFKVVANGVEMTDELTYAIPFGLLGRLANWLYVGREVKKIFDYRYKILETMFTDPVVLKRFA